MEKGQQFKVETLEDFINARKHFSNNWEDMSLDFDIAYFLYLKENNVDRYIVRWGDVEEYSLCGGILSCETIPNPLIPNTDEIQTVLNILWALRGEDKFYFEEYGRECLRVLLDNNVPN